MRKKIALFFILIVGVVSYGQNLIIRKIEVVNNREVPTATVVAQLSSKQGQEFSTDKMLKDYQALKALKYLDDATITPVTISNGVKLVVSVKEKENVRELLKKDGLYSETVTVDKNYTVSKVIISGNRHISSKELLNLIPLKAGQFLSKERIEKSFRMLVETGNFSAITPLFSEGDEPGRVNIEFKVVENPIVSGIKIQGNSLYTDAELKSTLKTKVGKIINVNDFKGENSNILEKYHKDGYTMANVVSMSLNKKNELVINVSEGVVREIKIKKMITKDKGRRKPGDDVLRTAEYIIRRELEIEPGEIFNANKFQRSYNNLMRLGYLKNIKHSVEVKENDLNGRYITLYIEEDKTMTLNGALSYGTESGLAASLSLKDSNFSGKGQELGFSFEKSNKGSASYTLNFYDPWIKDTKGVSWGWSFYKTAEGSESPLFARTDILGGNINIGKSLNRNLMFSIGAKYENIKESSNMNYFEATGNPNEFKYKPTGKLVEGLNDKYNTWSVYPFLVYDTRNRAFNASSGEYAKLKFEFGHAGGYKAGYFNNTTLDLRKYHKGFFTNNVFAYRFVGGIASETTKESQRFWVGGSNSIRGYEGGDFRGTKKIVLNIENRTQINDILGLVAFYDIGRAWEQNGRDPSYKNDGKKFGEDWAQGAGVGLRLNTPIGPLRFDFGWPLGKKSEGEDKMKFYFGMGHTF